jgi:phosphatidylglycerophosphatase A
MNKDSEAASIATARKPWLSYFFATAGGAGYLPAAPGTWGSLVGVLIYVLAGAPASHALDVGLHRGYFVFSSRCLLDVAITVVIALVGVVVAGRVARFTGRKDPQIVVIDEVSGQFLTYLLALAPLNWKYLLLGFILFRGFDTWKPFPARQAESLRGGWGIMADDWMAGIYAAAGLWIARALGL